MKKQSKWPDYLFTVTVRFICGVIFGGVVCLIFSYRRILSSFSHENTKGPLIWLALCALIGGIAAVWTTPDWQTPWYKRPKIGGDDE